MECFVKPAPKSQNDVSINSLEFNELPPVQSAGSSSSTSEPFKNNERHTSLILAGQDPNVSNSSERATQSRKYSSTPELTAPSTLVVPHRTTPPMSNPRPLGGVLTAVNTLGSFPIEGTIRNAELLHFCEP